ncbi:hypothetical protein MJO28_004643 [Puccinia striiformis f. sp. tritici]|uniref:Uncharacterized protein n=1 Tax=Puccinia striiformis f. sp. tritici TaxID=168172 RepID=A0ACC0ERP5_9BASI|nr:hypothetical protein MJO28_004643 [Puccinia striiformis f. sp. tritici]
MYRVAHQDLDDTFNWTFLSLVLVAYLHIIAGLSIKEANTTLVTIKMILEGFKVNPDYMQKRKIKFPIDIRTAIGLLGIEPVIHRTLCCPTCFRLYDSKDVRICEFKHTEKSRICNSALFGPNGRPLRQYSTQNFHQWLQGFLNREGIESLLTTSVNYFSQNVKSGTRSCLWDGTIWNDFLDSSGKPFNQTLGNLSFGIYIDWFNPHGNKAAGKHKSVGVILLFCLSLPASHRYQLQNIFFAALTPGPSEPTVLQMNNVLGPLVAELKGLWHQGVTIPTRHNPQGLEIKVALISAVCDLPAIRKLIGYGSHSARHFCSFCYLEDCEINSLDCTSWKKRTIQGHRAESEAWKSAKTHAERETLFKKSGVRYSILNELPYWDPTEFVVVEPMHLLSGILEWHARKVWCIDEVAAEIKNKKQVRDVRFPEPEDYFDVDTYEELRHEELNAGNNGINLELLQDALMEIEEEIRVDTEVNGPSVFSSDDLKLIRRVITQTKIPSWLNRPSPIFGDASAGKVRSADWITFFTVFMPFAINAELKKSPQDEFVESWYHLVMVAELAMEYKVDESSIQQYIFHLTAYRSNLQEYHSDLSATPNHHMAHHLPRQLYAFGPANYLASWHFEQINGILQKAATNNKINEMDLTILKHAGRASNLGILLESPDLPTVVAKMAPRFNQQKKLRSLLGDMNEVQYQSQEILDQEKLTKFRTNFIIPAHLHHRLISLLNSKYTQSGLQFVHKQKGDFSSSETIVPTVAKSIHSFKQAGLIYTDLSDKGSSSIAYRLGSTPQAFGTIVHMFQTVLFEACGQGKRSHKLHTFICVQRLERLSPFDEMKNPYPKACPEIKIKLFYPLPEMDHANRLRFCDLITPDQITYHTASFLHDKSVFGTEHHTIAVRSLDRNREGQFQ